MNLHTIEPAYLPKSKMSFLIDWLLTLKCNYDCAYCTVGMTGHDNSTNHPPYERCLSMLKHMYEYVDVVMENKKNSFKDVILNVYGGEALYHPDILLLLEQSSLMYQQYQTSWRLKRRMTTNATAQHKKWSEICKHIEGFTLSYHSYGPEKMKTLFKQNLQFLVDIKKEYDIVILMYPHKDHWKDCLDFYYYCKERKYNARPKLIDGKFGIYNDAQLDDLKKIFTAQELERFTPGKKIDMTTRGCCGGRPMCFNRDLKNKSRLVPRDTGFEGWHCSANQFFLFANCFTGEYFTNKDCRVTPQGAIGSISNIDTMDSYIKELKKNGMQTLVCKQKICLCGTCAPKSISKDTLDNILKTYNIN
jgi:MoaA/NifB/PqqE/SkfB family radical SAM enzyme